uniref:RNA-dependent RNA polymerase n=1 Tax=Plasmopara viticola lesion associated mitovirus 23 TaxID=2719449 RepID=A0A6G9RVA6_9VIRU|nr:RNA-dependent RNA polymerase [Plasmopara viticola lesion associated mitovirus 23]
MIIKNKNIFNKYKLIVKWVNASFLKIGYADQLIDIWFEKVEKQVQTRGVDDTIKRIKDSKLHITRYICGNSLLDSQNPSVGVNRKGLPKWLGKLNLLADGGLAEKRLLLTLLSVSRALPGSQYIPDITSISNPCTANLEKLNEYISYIPYVMDLMYIPKSLNVTWRRFHMTTKKGPLGPALLNAVEETKLLDDAMLKDIGTIAGSDLVNIINEMKLIDQEAYLKTISAKSMGKPSTDNGDKGMGKPSTPLRKLSIVHSPERKSRIIAILDYWTQTSLKPLHDRIFSILKGIKQDYTFNQQGVCKHLHSGPFYSLDLSSATDRFPIDFQKSVVENLVSKEYSEAWSRLLVDYEFYVPWSKTTVKYNCGQPMGAYSSWSVFTLSHHIIVRISALMVGLPQFDQYAILGDDIVIANKLVAEKYKEIVNNMGVEISYSKTHSSNNYYEFAKRWYDTSVEFTGAQINAFTNKGINWNTLINEYKELCIKWKIDEFETETRKIYNLFQISWPSYSHKRLERITKRAITFLKLPWRREGTDVDTQILDFVRHSCASSLGCFESAYRAKQIFIPAMAEIKARELDRGLISTKGKSDSIMKNLKLFLRGYKGCNPREALTSIPYVSLIMNQRSDLIESLEKLRDPMLLSAEDIVLNYKNSAPTMTFDPERIMAKRTHELMLSRDSSIVNNYNRWLKQYHLLKQNILKDAWDENTERSHVRKIFRTSTIGAVMPGFPL